MNSVTACQTVCKASGNLFSGVENADECWCGNVIHGAAKDQVDCGKACTGNSAQICGGVSRISIYQLTDVSPKWIRLGCYTDNSTARTLSHTVPATVLNTTTTNALCIKECQLFGYTYAGTEAGSQCYCGKAIQNAGVPAPEGASGCSTVCKGNATDTCGGTNRLTLSYLLS
jgi:glucan 1,3-beta-glucosidase